MWTIPLFTVRGALHLKAQSFRAHAAIRLAIQLAGNNRQLVEAIREAVWEAESCASVRIAYDPNALSGVERPA